MPNTIVDKKMKADKKTNASKKMKVAKKTRAGKIMKISKQKRFESEPEDDSELEDKAGKEAGIKMKAKGEMDAQMGSQPMSEADQAITPLPATPGSSQHILSQQEMQVMVRRIIENDPEIAIAIQDISVLMPEHMAMIVTALQAVPVRLPEHLKTADDVEAVCGMILEVHSTATPATPATPYLWNRPEIDDPAKRILAGVTAWWQKGAPQGANQGQVTFEQQVARNDGRVCPTLRLEELRELQHRLIAKGCLMYGQDRKGKAPLYLKDARLGDMMQQDPGRWAFAQYPESYRSLYRRQLAANALSKNYQQRRVISRIQPHHSRSNISAPIPNIGSAGSQTFIRNGTSDGPSIEELEPRRPPRPTLPSQRQLDRATLRRALGARRDPECARAGATKACAPATKLMDAVGLELLRHMQRQP
ncbi:hypothetical protein GGTG_07585 [Gaeumannomyces tritici R3-111a-1]|uniref:Uncharacterized protein n=1 Tax=Gaeumannomyces tritici (strain R3-111a-1) TaxID=644352 RepID=J3P237_GAET3|nr:hypothetical protein GGTG_07585 [Gaeumannomyces tritici R3-111a-1]EJT73729.1 hypothetical protein GGTG_07585 [Gaeumannomyces tritici R3-111a-1]